MKRHKVELIWGEDQEHGGHGWIPKLNPSFNAMQGFGVAHDVMEHTDLISGTLEEEMLAFGAMLYIRGEGGWWWSSIRGTSPAGNMKYDIAKFSHDVFYAKDRGCILGKPKRTLHTDCESDIEEIVQQSWRTLRAEFEYDDPEDWKTFTRRNPNWRKYLTGWIRRGYQECVRRYKGHKAWHLCDVFREITQKVDGYKHVEQGEELHITLEITQREVTPKFNLLRLDDLYAYEDNY